MCKWDCWGDELILCSMKKYSKQTLRKPSIWHRNYQQTSTCIRATLHCTALHYTTLHCTALHYTTLHCTALHCTTLHYTTLHCTALHCTALHYTTLHYTTLHCTTLHCTTLHCPLWHSPIDWSGIFTSCATFPIKLRNLARSDSISCLSFLACWDTIWSSYFTYVNIEICLNSI